MSQKTKSLHGGCERGWGGDVCYGQAVAGGRSAGFWDWLDLRGQGQPLRGMRGNVMKCALASAAGLLGLLLHSDCGGSGGYYPSLDKAKAGGTEEHPSIPIPGGVVCGSWLKERAPGAALQWGCCLQASSKLVNAQPW